MRWAPLALVLSFGLSTPAMGSPDEYLRSLDNLLFSYTDALYSREETKKVILQSRIRRHLFSELESSLYLQGLGRIVQFSSEQRVELTELALFLQKHWELRFARELEAIQAFHPATRERNARLGALGGATAWIAIERYSGFLKKAAVGPYFRLFRYLYPLRALLPLAGTAAGSQIDGNSGAHYARLSEKLPPAPAHIISLGTAANETHYAPDEDLKRIYQTVGATSILALGAVEAAALRPAVLRFLGASIKSPNPLKANLVILGSSVVLGVVFDRAAGEIHDGFQIRAASREFLNRAEHFMETLDDRTAGDLELYHAGSGLAQSAIRYAMMLSALEEQRHETFHYAALDRELYLIRAGSSADRRIEWDKRREDRRLVRALKNAITRRESASRDSSLILRQAIALIRQSPDAEIFEAWIQKLVGALLIHEEMKQPGGNLK